MRGALVREGNFLVEEQPVGLRLDGGADLGAEPLQGLFSAWLLDAHAEVDDDEVRVVG